MRISQIAIAISLILLPTASRAEQCSPQDYTSETPPNFDCPGPGEAQLRVKLNPPSSIAVREGEKVTAPWEGALVHRDRLIELGMAVKSVRRLRWVDSYTANRMCLANVDYQRRLGDIQTTHTQQQRDDFAQRLDASEKRYRDSMSWWRSPALWFALGVIAAGVFVALTAWGLSAIGS